MGTVGGKGPEVEGSWGKHGDLSKELGFCSQCLGEQGRGEVSLSLRLVGQGLRAARVSCSPAAPLGLPGPGRTAAARRLPQASGALIWRACALGMSDGPGLCPQRPDLWSEPDVGVFSPAPLCPGPCPRVLSRGQLRPVRPGGGRRGAFLLREWHTGQGRVCTTAL